MPRSSLQRLRGPQPSWLLAATAVACGGEEASRAPDLLERPVDTLVAPTSFRPNPAFRPSSPPIQNLVSAASIEGEVIVVTGDARTVSVQAPGELGVTEENQRAILEEVYALVPDRFDTLLIFTAFEDRAPMEPAYYRGLVNEVRGIGLETFNERESLGLPMSGRLSGYAGLSSPLLWGSGSLDRLNEPRGRFHALLAQALARRWAFYLRFRAPSGMPSTALLGPDDRGWSALAQSDGSVLGGNRLVRTAEPPDAMGYATYVNEGRNLAFSPWDLYAMGRLSPDRVPVLFYLTDATVDGQPVDRGSDIPAGAQVRGRPVLVSLPQVVEALGSRQPPAEVENPYYRAGLVFVTTPGAPRAEWAPQLELLQAVRADLPESWRAWGGGNLCTLATDPCPEPRLLVEGFELVGDQDGIIAPGEQAGLQLRLQNLGPGTAEGVAVRLVSTSTTVEVMGGPFIAPPLAQGQTVEMSDAFALVVDSSTTTCGTALQLTVEMTTREGPVFTQVIALAVGTNRLRYDPLEEAPDWRVDPEGRDTATAGAWALGEPEPTSNAGIVLQPASDHTPDGSLAFMTGPAAGGFFSTFDLDGASTLQSPVFAIGSSTDPFLVFWAWRRVFDFVRDPAGVAVDDVAPLVVQVSSDGGATWFELGRFAEQTEAWTRVSFRIRDAVEPTDRVRFRFVASEGEEELTAELGVDDLEIVDFLPTCEGAEPEPEPPGLDPDPEPPGPAPAASGGPRDEGGCTAAGSSSVSVLGLVVLLAGASRRRLRREQADSEGARARGDAAARTSDLGGRSRSRCWPRAGG